MCGVQPAHRRYSDCPRTLSRRCCQRIRLPIYAYYVIGLLLFIPSLVSFRNPSSRDVMFAIVVVCCPIALYRVLTHPISAQVPHLEDAHVAPPRRLRTSAYGLPQPRLRRGRAAGCLLPSAPFSFAFYHLPLRCHARMGKSCSPLRQWIALCGTELRGCA